MTVTISAVHNTARLNGTLTFLNSGNEPARIRIYSAPQPANGAEPDGVPLVEMALRKPAGTVVDGVLTLATAVDAMIMQSGVATWARVINGNNELAWDCDVTDSKGNGFIQLPSTTLYAGGVTRLVLGTIV
ncbi:hypothetical protein [Glaciimonas soli]|uniref:Uncharacterized protein n=1 Tax=Glaciimonas soli TaxID=2590999 RepID=A0A843YXX6_9BURK|nr:hypothetical protein [Glaciimonas soli]MQR02318.1 hypothetical protein [Glaciimonas soli]